ncbi:MAG TPA: alkaline phosphatase family protein [Bryobacteraceae bacterium]|nr:alkaline phosphatase family protein [Bryobacteraceae bacterium]
MTRRSLLAALAFAPVCRAQSKRTVLFICMDGCDPRYLKLSDIPNLKRMMAAGMYREGRSVMPSVTNVNNSSIATATFPSEHGITGNYYYDRATGKGTYMESPEFLLRPTIFEKARAHGYRTAFLCAKDKLRELLRKGADLAASAEQAPPELQRFAGPKADVYSADLNYWTFRAARHLLRNGYNFVFVSTTDYMMHTYAPEEAPSLEHMHEVDKLLGAIADDHRDIEIYFTADHGMNAKSKAVDLGRLLAREGIAAEAVPIIKDRYVKHHSNLGGSSYIYTKDIEKAAILLRSHAAIEQILSNQEAAVKFHLKPDRIGDLLALAKRDWVVGDLDAVEEDVKVRSHGSLHESTVPILCYGRKVKSSEYEYNMDITRRFGM